MNSKEKANQKRIKQIREKQKDISRELVRAVETLHSGAYIIKENGKYIIKHVPGFKGGVSTEEEIAKLVYDRIAMMKEKTELLRSKKYLAIYYGNRDVLYHINAVSKKYEIMCSWAREKNRWNVDSNLIIDESEVKEFTIKKNDWMEKQRVATEQLIIEKFNEICN